MPPMDTIVSENSSHLGKSVTPSQKEKKENFPMNTSVQGLLMRTNANSSDVALAATEGLMATANMNRQIIDAGRDLLRRQQDMAFDAMRQVFSTWAEPSRGGVQAFAQCSQDAVEEFTQNLRRIGDTILQNCMIQPRVGEMPRKDIQPR